MPRGIYTDLSIYQDQIRRLYQEDGLTFNEITEWCQANIPNAPSRRTIARRLRLWGIPARRVETRHGQQLNRRITELFLTNNISDEQIRQILAVEGFTVTPWALSRIIRPEQGLRRRTNRLEEQHEQINHAQRLFIEASSRGTFHDRMGMGLLQTDFRLQGLVIARDRFRVTHRNFRPQQVENRQIPRRGHAIYQGPNDVWCIDQYEKLGAFGFEGYCAIDAYSRYMIWGYIGHVGTTALSCLKQYLRCLQDTQKRPRKIRADRGRETRLICRAHYHLCVHSLMQYPHQYEDGANLENLEPAEVFLYGTSTRNVRIERWWLASSDAHFARYRDLFNMYAAEGLFIRGTFGILASDQIALYAVYERHIKTEFQRFVQVWNCHRIRSQPNRPYLPTGVPINIYYGIEQQNSRRPLVDAPGAEPPRRRLERSEPAADYGVPVDRNEVLSMLAPLNGIDIDSCLTAETRQWCDEQLDRLGWTGLLGPDADRGRPFERFYLAMRIRVREHFEAGEEPHLAIGARYPGGYQRYEEMLQEYEGQLFEDEDNIDED